MDYEKEDLAIWENSRMNLQPRHEVLLFGLDRLYICKEAEISEISLDRRALLEIALFNLFCTFWRAVSNLPKDKALDEELQSLIGYHLRLQEKVVQALSDSKESQQRVSALLQPWLRRTLWLFNHDDRSRKLFSDADCPTLLLDYSGSGPTLFLTN
jgi:hypothetical protein